MADPSPCPICRAKGGFHDSHPFSIEWAREKWGPPYALPPTDEEAEKGYQPYCFLVGQDEYVIVKKKVVNEV